MRLGAPYRPPCGGWPATTAPDILVSHYRESENGIARFDNVTQVANYADPASVPTPPAMIAPYPRPNVPSAFLSTGCADPPSYGGLGEVNIGPWPVSELPSGDGAIDHNFYEAVAGIGARIDRAVCEKKGFKAVQGEVWFYGRVGFLNRDGCQVSPGGDCACDHYESIGVTGPTVKKYLTMRVEITHWQLVADDLDHSVERRHWIRDYSVDAQSGVITLNEGLDEGTTTYPGNGAETALSLAAVGSPGPLRGINVCGKNDYVEAAKVAAAASLDGSDRNINDPYVSWDVTEDLAGDSYHAVLTHYSDAAGNPAVEGAEITMQLSDPMTGLDVYTDLKLLTSYWPLNDDKLLPWRVDGFTTVAPLVTRNQVGGYVTPDIWAATQIDDVNGNHPGTLAGDHGQLPDGAPVDYIPTAWTDPNMVTGQGEVVDGSIRGKPNPAGYAGHFDRRHETIKVCHEEDTGYHYYTAFFGAFSGVTNEGDGTDSVVPFNATQWTNNFQAGEFKLPQGYVRSTPNGPCDLGKYAEIQVRRPSVNFFGTCGNQRFAMDEAMIRCVESTAMSGTVVTIMVDIVADGTAHDGEVGDSFKGRICGVSSDLDGIWTVTKAGSDTYTIDTAVGKICLAQDATDGSCTGVIGKLRFPDAWPICGRIKVAKATADGGDLVIEMEEAAPYLRTEDKIDFTTDGVAMVANLPVTVINEKTFRVTSSIRTDWVQAAGSPQYWWFDEMSKGDYLAFEAWHNFRDIAENDRQIAAATACACDAVGTVAPLRQWQASYGLPRSVTGFSVTPGCLPFLQCCPGVICFSPNAEVFVNGRTYWLDEALAGDGNSLVAWAPDDRYGSLRQLWVETTMVKPDWQQPHRTCADGLETTLPDVHWDMDDGTCNPATQFAHWPVVEARASVPDGAPALADGLAINFLTMEEIDVETISAAGKVPVVPISPGINPAVGPDPVQPETPWGLLLAERSCVYGLPPGQFANEYKGDGV